MNIKRIGIVLIFIGIFLSVYFVNDRTYLVPALTITILGFFITLVGFLDDVPKCMLIYFLSLNRLYTCKSQI